MSNGAPPETARTTPSSASVSHLLTRTLRHLARAALAALGVLLVSFTLIHLIPGDPVELLLGDTATAELVAKYRQILGLEGSLPQQFARYLGSVAQGDLGTSIQTGQSVNSVVARTLPLTAWLIGVTVLMALLMAIPLGVAAALLRGTWFDHAFRVSTSVSLATPSFYFGLLLILLFAVRLGWAPVAGYQPGFPGNLQYLWLPALTMSGALVPILARVLQSSIAETMEQEFVETAIVRGLPAPVLVWRYLLRPSLAPTISLLGYILGQLLSATVVVEIVFNLPGMGTALVVEGVLLRDYPVVQGIILIFALIVVAVSFLSDTVSGWLDPRTRVS